MLAVFDNWPQNTFGGLFGGELKVLLKQNVEDIEPLCTVHTGFKVRKILEIKLVLSHVFM